MALANKNKNKKTWEALPRGAGTWQHGDTCTTFWKEAPRKLKVYF